MTTLTDKQIKIALDQYKNRIEKDKNYYHIHRKNDKAYIEKNRKRSAIWYENNKDKKQQYYKDNKLLMNAKSKYKYYLKQKKYMEFVTVQKSSYELLKQIMWNVDPLFDAAYIQSTSPVETDLLPIKPL